MRIEYDFESKKKIKHLLNVGMGIAGQKRRVVKNTLKKPKTLIQLCIRNYLLCFIDLILFSFLFDFNDDLATLLLIVIVVVFFLTTLSLFCYVFNLKNNNLRGEILFSEKGIEETTGNGRVIQCSWDKIQFVYVTEEAIYILTNFGFFFFNHVKNNLEEVNSVIKKYKPNLKVIESEFVEINPFKNHFWNWGIYVIIFLISFFSSIGYDVHNTSILNKEVEKILSSREVDFTISSSGKFGIIEKYFKKYYFEFYQNVEDYEKNSAMGILYSITSDMLEDDKEELSNLLNTLSTKEDNAHHTMERIIEMYDEEFALSYIVDENLGEYYEDIYLDCIFFAEPIEYRNQLLLELETNTLKMDYLEKLINLLITYDSKWYIEDEKLYFSDDELLEEYNHLYDLIMEESRKEGIEL